MGTGEGRAPVVAVDGPSGSGKSTVSRRLAVTLGTRYLDTGAMYRAVTWAVLAAGIDPSDASAVTKIAAALRFDVGTDPVRPYLRVDETMVDDYAAALAGSGGEGGLGGEGGSGGEGGVGSPIRGPRVTGAVSAVSAVPGVRQILVARQQEIIVAARRGPGIVVEGRDIGTVVAPDADLKIFLTASAGERARRRSFEQAADLHVTAADLARRDLIDSTRSADPLAQAVDAVVLDSTELGIDEVVSRVVALLAERRGRD